MTSSVLGINWTDLLFLVIVVIDRKCGQDSGRMTCGKVLDNPEVKLSNQLFRVCLPMCNVP